MSKQASKKYLGRLPLDRFDQQQCAAAPVQDSGTAEASRRRLVRSRRDRCGDVACPMIA
jgi:hypothetical protein